MKVSLPKDGLRQHAPLYLPRYLKKHKPNDNLVPAEHLQIIRQWQELLGNPKKNKDLIGERKLESELTQSFLQQILGWHSVTDSNPTLKSQPPIKGESRTPEIAMGRELDGEWQSLILGEYKAPKTGLDDKQSAGYQYRTPVEQARNYASLVPCCQFYLVTNMTEWRLYARNGDPNRYESWQLDALHEPENYWRFTALLSESYVLSGRTNQWLDESNQQDKEITQKLYGEYQRMRWGIITGLAEANPHLTALQLIEPSQTLLDRVLFIAFAEDNALLRKDIYKQTITQTALYSAWENLQALFRFIDIGKQDAKNPTNSIPAYNGGLFAPNPALESLNVPDDLLHILLPLVEYDFDTEVRVTVLGHMFEQSVAELEQLREAAEIDPKAFVADLATRIKPIESKGRSVSGKRKEDGIVYTPDVISRFIAKKTLGGYLDARQEETRKKFQVGNDCWREPTKKELSGNKATRGHLSREQLVEWLFWNEWKHTLMTIKVVDPSCGSGAFLVAAFDVIAPYYEEAERAINAISPNMEGFDGDRAILTNNLYGVDINAGAVEIAKLSLWLKTAKQGRKLDSLDGQIVCGNSLHFEPKQKSIFASDQFGWHEDFKNIMDDGGFDVVLGNPPYVRMEVLKSIKPFLEKNFSVVSDRADLYCYFYEVGVRLLRSGGRLGYISSSTFFKTGSGEPLRRYLLNNAALNSVIDFGDLQVFEGVTTYPAIIILEKGKADAQHTFSFAAIRQQEELISLESVFEHAASPMDQNKLSDKSWQLGSDTVTALREKITHGHKTLKETYGPPLYGIKTGLNDAFVIDDATRNQLIAKDPKSSELLKPFLEGKDLKKWRVEPQGLWIIYIPKGKVNIDSYPAIRDYMLPFKDKLEKRATKQEWFELQQAQEAYVPMLESPKIAYAQIASQPPFSMECSNYYVNNKIYFLPSNDWYLLALLSSKTCWFHLCGVASILRGGFLELISQYMETVPVPDASPEIRAALASLATSSQNMAETRYQKKNEMQGVLSSQEFSAGKKLTTIMKECWKLEFPAFLAQLKKDLKYSMPPTEQAGWKQFLDEGRAEIQKLDIEIAKAEQEINQIVYGLFGLTAEEIALIEQAS